MPEKPSQRPLNFAPLFPALPRPRLFAASAVLVVVMAGLNGCAGGPTPGSAISEASSAQPNSGIQNVANPQGIGSGEEVGCKRLTGKMKVRILQIRDYNPATKTSGLSRGLQGFASGIFGGTSTGLNPDAQYQKDVAQLKQQNASLAARGCKTFDLGTELQAKSFRATPNVQ